MRPHSPRSCAWWILSALTLFAEEPNPPLDTLPGSGRRMLSLPREGSRLSGHAPKGEGGPFCILNGSSLLWQGEEGEAFSLPVEAGKRLYLLSLGAENKKWSDLRWEGSSPQASPPKAGETASTPSGKSTLHLAPPPHEEDAGPPLRELIDQARRTEGDVVIQLQPGVYHFYAKGALPMSLYTSNHDQQDIHPIGIPLVNLKGVCLEGNGARFVFHGRMIPILIMDSEGVSCRNFSLSYSTPSASEGRITELGKGTATVEIDPLFSWDVKEGVFFTTGEDWEEPALCALAFCEDGSMAPTGRSGDIPWATSAEKLSDTRVRFHRDASDDGLSVGQTLILRSYARPHPAMLLYRARQIRLDGVVFHDSRGMGLLAQRSEDIVIRGGGCIRSGKRFHTTAADATHFSNCRGEIRVEGVLYEGMMDDAINVHSTCLSISKILSPVEIEAEYKHPQTVGMEILLPGESLQFIRSRTLENTEETRRALRVQQLDERRISILLDRALPEGIGVGDAFENADWYPAVSFRGNTVRHNRARCALLTTPRPVRVENNRFLRCSGSAILLAGDAQGWYESGRCRDVVIRNNLFDHNLTSRYQFTEGIISIYPEVEAPEQQKTRYHENILIEENVFLTHRAPLLYAISASNITFRNNTVVYDDKYAPLHDGQPFILQFCEKAHLDMRTETAQRNDLNATPPGGTTAPQGEACLSSAEE